MFIARNEIIHQLDLREPDAQNRGSLAHKRETRSLEDIRNYGVTLQKEISRILDARGIEHCFTGAPALAGLFFAEKAPSNYREWLHSDYAFYDALAPELHEQGILVEPDSREPWFLCEAHTDNCLDDTLNRFERAVDITIEKQSNAA